MGDKIKEKDMEQVVEIELGKVTTQTTEAGTIRIADDVVAIIAGLAASEVKGVASMSGGFVGGIVDLVGKKSPARGVKVEVGEKEAAIDIHVMVEFGTRIPEVANEIQRNVKKAIENMTGLTVIEVNVHIQGVVLPNESKEEENPRVNPRVK